jgi:hypothetical protein
MIRIGGKRIRQKCIDKGCLWWSTYPGAPIEFCRRWRCEQERVSPYVWDNAPELARSLSTYTGEKYRRKL